MVKKIKIWIECARLRTLPVSVAGVVAACALALRHGVFAWVPAVLCFVFAVLAQVVSNFANEYYDFKRGADKKGRVGPRRGVTEGDIKPDTLRAVTFVTLLVACLVGCCLIPFGGWWLIVVGIFIAIFALAYSAGPYPLSYHGLGDVAVLLFFGIVPVNLTYYVQSGVLYELDVMLASIAIGLMGVNVLVVNNYRDMDDDREAGKHTTVVIFGRKVAAIAYLVNGFVAMALLVPVWVSTHWIALAIPLIYLILHAVAWRGLVARTGAALNPLLGITSINMLLFSLLLALYCALL
ncbi:MAG TPA: 1,4-dihydroxy-2-naphthoate octaprenyltransferase [Candidatus Avimuribaculum pullicola]|nr:1,4-dihydroxy-2-naphthoate octaprenyltransferase [Candidatus Avimuribaculum pullicola]